MTGQRTYLVIMDETPEAALALRFAARRAARTRGTVHILALVPRQDFSLFGGVQATIEAEARERAEMVVTTAAGGLISEVGLAPVIAVRMGDGAKEVSTYLAAHPEVSALVLGVAREGSPGPLVAHFAAASGKLPCPLMLVPGDLAQDDLDRLS